MVTDPSNLMWAIVLNETPVNPGLCNIHVDDPVADNNMRKHIWETITTTSFHDLPILNRIFNKALVDVTGNNNIFCYICGRKWYELLGAKQFE